MYQGANSKGTPLTWKHMAIAIGAIVLGIGAPIEYSRMSYTGTWNREKQNTIIQYRKEQEKKLERFIDANSDGILSLDELLAFCKVADIKTSDVNIEYWDGILGRPRNCERSYRLPRRIVENYRGAEDSFWSVPPESKKVEELVKKYEAMQKQNMKGLEDFFKGKYLHNPNLSGNPDTPNSVYKK